MNLVTTDTRAPEWNIVIRPFLPLALAVALGFAAEAAQYPPHYRWRTIETAHFLVHYPQGGEDLGLRAASIAEAAHERIVPIFEWAPSEKTHLVLTDHIDASNGSATPFPSNRMEVWVSAPGADPASPLDYYDDWLNLVITHEYAHIVHLDMARGLSRGVRRIFGRTPASFPNIFSPLWMIEGIATLIESEVTEAGRLKGTFLDMVLRTAAIEGRFPTEPQASDLPARGRRAMPATSMDRLFFRGWPGPKGPRIWLATFTTMPATSSPTV
jgi:hypothetical protein